MAKNKSGPKYRVPFRRRREGKTNYHRRLRLIISHRNRLVVRASSKHTTVTVVKSLVDGDQMLAQSHSSQLSKEFSWVFHPGNLPSAYLTGYLCGMRAKKAGIDDAILDVGILVHDNRVKAAFKGFLDAGIEVPHDDAWFSEHMETRMNGEHIQNYAKLLSKDNSKKYKKIFSATLKRKGDPTKIVDQWNKVKDAIEKKV
ncbi:MAG: 50S ribosomal protein L18 [Promethearchaeota archaeon]